MMGGGEVVVEKTKENEGVKEEALWN